jgi:branched-chain amino acid transport system ATP-binding protein
MTEVPILQLEGVRARYGQARILDGVDLSVSAGEVVALIGRNGAGKTTTLMSLFGVPTVDGGRILIHGEEVRPRSPHEAARRGLAISPQGRRILSNLTVEENLLLGKAAGRTGPWTLEAVYDLFGILGERRATPGTAMSGGQQQMLAIGRALMANPALLLLDEPSEGLAPVLIDEIGDVLLRIRNEGTAILIVEQHLNLVLRVADRFVVLAKGRVAASGLLEHLDIDELRSVLVV